MFLPTKLKIQSLWILKPNGFSYLFYVQEMAQLKWSWQELVLPKKDHMQKETEREVIVFVFVLSWW